MGVSSRLYVTLGIFGGRGGSSVGTSNTVSWSDRVTAGSNTGIWYQVGTLVKTIGGTESLRDCPKLFDLSDRKSRPEESGTGISADLICSSVDEISLWMERLG